MTLRLGPWRTLRNIERDLADSDSGLDELFCSFTEMVGDELMPSTEKITTRPLRLLALLGLRSGRRQAMRRATQDQRS